VSAAAIFHKKAADESAALIVVRGLSDPWFSQR
jgi:hypothetical protein